MKRAATLAHIRQLSCLGLSSESLMPSLLRAVREYADAESAGFFWVNAEGEMTNLYAERMLPPGLMKLYFERHYDGDEQPFRSAFLERARAPDGVVSTSASPELMRTAYYNEILRHLDAFHVMYAIVRNHGHALGQLSLYRPRTAQPFTPGERAAVQDVARYIAHAVARPEVNDDLAGQFADTDQEGIVVISANGKIAQGSTQSLNLLSYATRANIRKETPPLAVGDDMPRSVATLVMGVRALLRGVVAPPPREVLETQWGRFLLSGYALAEAPDAEGCPVAIHVKRQEQMLIRFARAIGALGLPPQLQEVALLIARGRNNQEIAEEMSISRNTANYHVKQLFMRLDVHERSEALKRILAAPPGEG